MPISILPFVVDMKDKFVPAPGHERPEDTMIPGEKSLTVVFEGMEQLINSGFVTLLVLPVLAVGLYVSGFRVAGPIVGLLALGLFMARMFGAAT